MTTARCEAGLAGAQSRRICSYAHEPPEPALSSSRLQGGRSRTGPSASSPEVTADISPEESTSQRRQGSESSDQPGSEPEVWPTPSLTTVGTACVRCSNAVTSKLAKRTDPASLTAETLSCLRTFSRSSISESPGWRSPRSPADHPSRGEHGRPGPLRRTFLIRGSHPEECPTMGSQATPGETRARRRPGDPQAVLGFLRILWSGTGCGITAIT